jgi:hypothetical protein
VSHRTIALRILVVLAVLCSLGFLVDKQTSISSAHSLNSTTYTESYAVKFVCGLQTGQTTSNGEPPTKPGNYATEINIFNFSPTAQVQITKRIVTLVGTPIGRTPIFAREPTVSAAPATPTMFALPSLNGTMDDCPEILSLGGLTTAYAIGYFVIHSTALLNVTAVYTAEPPTTSTGVIPGIAEQTVNEPAFTISSPN